MVEAIAPFSEVTCHATVVIDDLVDLDHAFADRDVKDANVFFDEVELPAGCETEVVAVELLGLVEVL